MMEEKNLFAALESEEPAVSLGEIESYTRRKVRQRKIQIRTVVVVALIAAVLTPLMLKQSKIKTPGVVIKVLPQPPNEVRDEQQITHSAPPDIAAATAQRVVRPRDRESKHEPAPVLFDAEKAFVTVALLQIQSPDPPGFRESIASSFSANTIQ